MLDFILDLQLFADGAEGGSTGEGGEVASGVSGSEAELGEDIQIPRFVPERAKKRYIESVKAARSAAKTTDASEQKQETPAEPPTETSAEKIPYSELIKSDEYKSDHEAYMKATIESRLKKYKGIEAELDKAKRITARLAEKYGIDAKSNTFFDEIEKAQKSDETENRVKQYMYDHDVEEDEAKRIVGMETALREKKEQEEARKIAEENLRRQQEQEDLRQKLLASAEQTKAKYPSFDLGTELQDERFRRICAVTGGDTTAAYIAAHHGEILQSTAIAAANAASIQVANTVAANKARPDENGLRQSPPAVSEKDFSKMSAKELHAYWEKMRKTRR